MMLWNCRACGARWSHDSGTCPLCLGPGKLAEAPRRGAVVEWSEMGGAVFCAADFGGVRLICPVSSGTPAPGRTAELVGDGAEVRILPDP